MPRDFKSFSKENNNFSKQNENILNENQEKVNQYENIINKYKGMSNNELMQNLFTEASKLKQKGQLTNESLSSLKSTLSPFLNSEQNEMLTNLINALNEQK